MSLVLSVRLSVSLCSLPVSLPLSLSVSCLGYVRQAATLSALFLLQFCLPSPSASPSLSGDPQWHDESQLRAPLGGWIMLLLLLPLGTLHEQSRAGGVEGGRVAKLAAATVESFGHLAAQTMRMPQRDDVENVAGAHATKGGWEGGGETADKLSTAFIAA